MYYCIDAILLLCDMPVLVGVAMFADYARILVFVLNFLD